MYRVTKTYGHDRGFSCAFRQWSSGTDCQYLHGYSLGFKVVLESPTLDVNNWVYDFGKFKFLETWLKERFDHTLLVAKDDPELDIKNDSRDVNTSLEDIKFNVKDDFLNIFLDLKLVLYKI